ncbi:ThuA domain-containing protein [Labrys wisconsinensis]|uniref:Trehalose utilization protein n=1 Tax=Labrys wisconsinensis TaxID=425677 RepID=A0ABU0J210_9HYPH|nr:ThuA domain-containing protein [Labrys wisconsinensis]MDQ0468288.1 trehalose utilization protein [Labrys wisconsinensis]
MTIRALVWNENRHEQTNALVRRLYPEGIHGEIAGVLRAAGGISVETATLDEPEHGLTVERLAATDVLVWWGHTAHGEVKDEIVQRVQERVWEGMGLIVLHSGHFSKIFKRLMGTPCALSWREAGEVERLWVLNPNHPIAAGLPPFFEIEHEEMYGEPFTVPEPMETLFVSWFEGGEVFRSGLTYQRGAGRIFYFRPGHEAYPTYHHPVVRQVLANATRWAYNPATAWKRVNQAPNVPPETAPVPLTVKGPRLHADGEEGFR